jgi:hypothetical protein
MDTTGINGTHIHPERWYRTSLTTNKFHLVHDILGERNFTIKTRCGLHILANNGEKELVDWTKKPSRHEQCKTCACCPSKIYPDYKGILPTPKVIWGAAVNLSGLWGPYKMKYDQQSETYYDRLGNFSVDCIGLNQKDGVIEFGSESEEETKLWVSGVKAAMKMISRWCSE